MCRLYGNSTVDDINEVRYRRFSANRVPDPRKLPRTQDALYLHIKRANYQSFVWKRALCYEYSNPVGNGWIREDGALSIQWTLNRPAPDEILEFISCNCKKSKCATNDCQCKSVSLDCIDMCKCDGCPNGNVMDVQMEMSLMTIRHMKHQVVTVAIQLKVNLKMMIYFKTKALITN